MTRKKQRNYLSRKNLVMLSCIFALNFLGVSYAAWTDGLGSRLTLSTGNIDPVFYKNICLDKSKGKGELSIRFTDKHTMYIKGKVTPDYKATIKYNVLNEGTLPVKYTPAPQNQVKDLKLQLTQYPGVIQPKKSYSGLTGDSKLDISAQKKGKYDFELQLPFTQWTK